MLQWHITDQNWIHPTTLSEDFLYSCISFGDETCGQEEEWLWYPRHAS